jgi:hypothetical protein
MLRADATESHSGVSVTGTRPDCLLSLYNTAPQTRPARAAVRVHASAAPEAVPSRRAMVASLLAGASSLSTEVRLSFFSSAVPLSLNSVHRHTPAPRRCALRRRCSPRAGPQQGWREGAGGRGGGGAFRYGGVVSIGVRVLST